MTDNDAIRQEIIDRLGCPEPVLPGVTYIGTSSPSQTELMHLFDEMCMVDIHDRAIFERAIATLERARARDYQAFYLGRSELLSMYPVVHAVPTGPA